jgi:Tol biopolymer transport system component/serine/threonine protein kinase
MTPERRQQIEKLLQETLACEPVARPGFLARACAGDEALRQEVESLLKAHGEAGQEFIEASGQDVMAEEMASERVTTGRRISHYQILSLLGKGGMGEVFLALDVRLQRKVALKMLPEEFLRYASRVARFVREAIAVSALNHPNIITIHEIGEDADALFIAMEFVEGRTLRAMISEGCGLERLAQWGGQIARALSVAHATGITHRDIKPENIIVRTDGYVKVLDFGLARLAPPVLDMEAVTLQGTMPGTLLGTVKYMSPEQARGEVAGNASDIFSLGVIFYEMTTGNHPVYHDSLLGVLNSITTEKPAPPSQLNPEITAPLEALILRMLEKDARSRPTAAQVEAELAHLAGMSVGREIDRTMPGRRQTDQTPPEGGHETDRRLFLKTDPTPPARTDGRRLRKGGVAVAVAVLLAVGSGLGVWFYRSIRKEPLAALSAMRVSLLTSYAGSQREPAFSPDGQRIAFIWDGGNENHPEATDIYVSLLGVGNPLRLTSDPASDHRPVWSPDGNYIAFLRQQSRGVETLMLVPALGGTERRLDQVAGGLDWSPDGKWLAVVRRGEPDRYDSIFLLNIETKENRRITQRQEGAMRDDAPAFSPDGKTIAFIRFVSSGVSELYVVPASGGAPSRRLTFDNRLLMSVCWTRDGSHLIFASNRSGRNSLWKLPITGGAPEQITAVAGNVIDVSVARQGAWLACTQEGTYTSIYLTELAATKSRKWVKFIFSAQSEHSPQFSPDGRQIAWVSNRTGSPEIWVCDGDGQHPARLTYFNGPQTGSPHWSPNSQEIVFDSRPEGQADIFVIGAQGGRPRQLTSEKSLEVVPCWSGDGQWIYFSSNRTGERQIWKVPAAGGTAVQVTRKGGFESAESPDGQFVIYSKDRDVAGLWRVPVAGGEEEPIPELATAGYHRYWSLTKTGILFVPQDVQPRPVINFFNFASRQVTQVAWPDKVPIYGPPGMAMSPDGRRLLYAQMDRVVSDITLVENFR